MLCGALTYKAAAATSILALTNNDLCGPSKCVTRPDYTGCQRVALLIPREASHIDSFGSLHSL